MVRNKHVFWQALIVALVIFCSGLVLGIWFEENRVNKFKQFYYNSETELFDILLQENILSASNFSCSLIAINGIALADGIYEDARQLEKYDEANKITDDALQLHRKYDLLRTFLWESLSQHQKRCSSDFNIVVYLYQYKEPSVNLQARQAAMSKVLIDLKRKYGDKIILIPIAYDTDISSLDYLMVRYNLSKKPVVFINQNFTISDLSSVEELENVIFKGNKE